MKRGTGRKYLRGGEEGRGDKDGLGIKSRYIILKLSM
jgi:hypothetical protein